MTFSHATHPHRKVHLYGASVVAPGAANLNEFLTVIAEGRSVLKSKESLSDAFLVGEPKFDFSIYKEWLDERFGPKRYSLFTEKSGDLVRYSIGTFIDILKDNPALEPVLKKLDSRVSIYYANGLSDLPINFKAAREFDRTMERWNAFWANPIRNKLCAIHLNKKETHPDAPKNPDNFVVDSIERMEAVRVWNAFWTRESPLLREYLLELKKIESEPVHGEDIESAKLANIRAKGKARKELQEKYGFPTPPWEGVSPNLLWNIPNVPASQISMLLGLHGSTLGLAGACASFGVLIEKALHEIREGRIDVAIIGAVDANPSNELVSAFYSGRLAVLGDSHGVPFCDLRGTHISGGACTWILAAEDVMQESGINPLPVEILGAGVSSDAEHIITPSKEGPKLAIQKAFQISNIKPEQISLWDMHATGTPGDWNEFCLIKDFVPQTAYISARKGIFGHGMSVGGGWELTAQLLGTQSQGNGIFKLLPSGIQPEKVNPKIASLNRNLLLNKSVELESKGNELYCGKLSMGLGGVSSCVISRLHAKI